MNCERLSGCITTRTLYFSGRFGTLLARYGTRSSLPWPLGHLAWGIILSFINRLAESGADAFTIMKLMGHSSIVVSQRYVHPSTDAMKRAISGMELGIV